MGIEYPDFTSDSGKVQLLREMEKKKEGKLFFAKLLYIGNDIEARDDDGYITRNYITDETGALLNAVWEFPPFVEWRKEKEPIELGRKPLETIYDLKEKKNEWN